MYSKRALRHVFTSLTINRDNEKLLRDLHSYAYISQVIFSHQLFDQNYLRIFVCRVKDWSLLHLVRHYFVTLIIFRYLHKLWESSLYQNHSSAIHNALPWNILSWYKNKCKLFYACLLNISVFWYLTPCRMMDRFNSLKWNCLLYFLPWKWTRQFHAKNDSTEYIAFLNDFLKSLQYFILWHSKSDCPAGNSFCTPTGTTALCLQCFEICQREEIFLH